MTPTELVAKKASTWAQMQDLDKRASDEKRPLSQEELNQWNTLESELSNLEDNVTRAEKAEKLEERFATKVDSAVVNAPAAAGSEITPERRYADAFSRWARLGASDIEPEDRAVLKAGFVSGQELRAQGVGTTTAGGYAVPEGFRQKLIETQKAFGSVRSVAEVISTDSGQALPWPTMDDTANVGAILAENTAVTEQDVTLGTGLLEAYMYTSKLVRVSLQLIQDSGFDVDDWLPRVLGQRIARIQNQHFTTGTGTGQPDGIQTNATSAVTLPVGNTTTLTYDGLVDLVEAVDPAYRPNGKFMARSIGAVRKIKTTDGMPLWQPALTAGAPDSILGYPVVVNPDMPTAAASVKSVLFGDFREAYVIRDVTGVQTLRLTERYADFLQVGFLLFQRTDATVQQSAAVRALTQSAT